MAQTGWEHGTMKINSSQKQFQPPMVSVYVNLNSSSARVFVLVFSFFPIFSDPWSLKIENENTGNNMKT